MTSAPKPTTWRRLLALDFDDTIAAQNTDLVVRDLLDAAQLTPELDQLYKDTGWTAYMQAIFQLLAAARWSRDQIRTAIKGIQEVPGMVHLITQLADHHSFDVIIISDSNAEFIRTWCAEQPGLDQRLNAVFTNPASFADDTDLLTIEPFHHQTECSLSTANLCKGRILEEFVAARAANDGIAYSRVFYGGDGRNDVCPSLRLGRQDFACARIGMTMDKSLQARLAAQDTELAAEVLRWTNGADLLEQIVERIRGESVVPDNAGTLVSTITKRKLTNFWK